MKDEWKSDNRRIKQGRSYAEFLAVAIREERGDEYPSPYEIRISRYSCPGRCDSYSFAWTQKGEVIFHSETNDTLPQSLKQIQADLDKTQIVEMILAMRRTFGFSNLTMLLKDIAPKSAVLKAILKQIK